MNKIRVITSLLVFSFALVSYQVGNSETFLRHCLRYITIILNFKLNALKLEKLMKIIFKLFQKEISKLVYLDQSRQIHPE